MRTLYLIDDDDPGANDCTVVNKSFTLFGQTFFEAVPQFKFKCLAGTALWSCQITWCVSGSATCLVFYSDPCAGFHVFSFRKVW